MERAFLLLVFTAGTFAFGQAASDRAQEEANKKIAISFFNAGPTKPDVMASLLADDYVQHNPRFVKYNEDHHVSGRQGFVEALKSGILRPPASAVPNAPPPLPPRTQEFVMAEGDLVTIVWKQMRPDPADPATIYASYAFDTFRVKNGKLAEHWDGSLR